eukprot:scaffold3182_cov45-Prasinocladus_malaysianus.AAC.1
MDNRKLPRFMEDARRRSPGEPAAAKTCRNKCDVAEDEDEVLQDDEHDDSSVEPRELLLPRSLWARVTKLCSHFELTEAQYTQSRWTDRSQAQKLAPGHYISAKMRQAVLKRALDAWNPSQLQLEPNATMSYSDNNAVHNVQQSYFPRSPSTTDSSLQYTSSSSGSTYERGCWSSLPSTFCELLYDRLDNRDRGPYRLVCKQWSVELAAAAKYLTVEQDFNPGQKAALSFPNIMSLSVNVNRRHPLVGLNWMLNLSELKDLRLEGAPQFDSELELQTSKLTTLSSLEMVGLELSGWNNSPVADLPGLKSLRVVDCNGLQYPSCSPLLAIRHLTELTRLEWIAEDLNGHAVCAQTRILEAATVSCKLCSFIRHFDTRAFHSSTWRQTNT